MAGSHARVRLTRRGRLVILVFLLALAGVGAAVVAPQSRAAEPPGSRPVAVVEQGDSLWSISERYLPGVDPLTAIEEIRQLNGLIGYTVYAGQRLVLPPRR